MHNSSHPPQNPHWGWEFTPSPLSTGSTSIPDGDLFTDSSRIPQPQFQPGAYMHENQQFQTLREQYRALESQIVKVTAKCDSVIAAYQYLASAVHFPINDPFQFNPLSIPTPTSTSNAEHPNPETHPNVRFWDKAEYLKWLDSADAEHTALHGKLAFLEDSNGNPVLETTINAIRKALHAAWSELLIHKLTPLTWGKLTTSGTQLMNSLMENAYPLFKLANNSWKLDYLATMSYSSWWQNHMDECGNPLVGGDEEGDTTSKGKKRKRHIKSEAPEVPEKKIKVNCGALEITILPPTPPPSSISSLPECPMPSLTPSYPPQAEEGATTTSAIPQESTPQVHEAVAVPVLEDIQPKSILPEPICAPKPVKITIINPLSTLAFVASSVTSINPSLELQSTSEPAPKDVLGSVLQVAPNSTSKTKTIKRGGKTDEFNNYYGSLTPDQHGKYNEEAKILVAKNMWTKNVNEGHVY
ncbi:uncharacterized protein BJ212DRAFT_1296181 [Suillus subaureus]|uniref:Uncharacterized protein n=1 Tax=Suillus subaureus TaxID=48587 RepID=A0A9P7JHY8_9AGAM|nr:uncharacterized protein BJ212DRAFT_1296181 [Suillus subaureus]KAG1823590.1 hypothetical protein BJ212DRAFT_1296181 [Suillus subaureus]